MLANKTSSTFDNTDYTALILSGYSDVRYEVLSGKCPPSQIAQRLTEAFNTCYTEDFLQIPPSRRHKLESLGPKTSIRVIQDLEWVADELRKRWRSVPTDTLDGLKDFISELDLEVAKIGRKIIARRFAGASQEELAAFISGAKELLQGAMWAANAAIVTKEAKLNAIDAAIAIYAAALRSGNTDEIAVKRSVLSRLVGRHNEAKPLRIGQYEIPVRAPVTILKRMIEDAAGKIDRFETHLAAYHHLANRIANEVDLRPALAFERAPSYAVSAEEALDRIIDGITQAYYGRMGSEMTAANLNAFQITHLLPQLQAYSYQLSEERAANRQVEQYWRDVDRDLEFALRSAYRSQKTPSVPLHDGVDAVTAYAMYCCDAVSKGVPVGSVLFGNNFKLFEFGDTERRFIMQATLYEARRFAANYMHSSSSALKRLAEQEPDRYNNLVRALEEIELKVRAYAEQHDGVDHDTLHAVVVGLVSPLARDWPADTQAFLLEDAPHQIAHRVLAKREIAQIDYYLHAHGSIAREIAERYAHELPFTSYVKHSRYDGSTLRNIIARNGQSLEELSRDVLVRMERYRAQAPEGIDVVPVEIDMTLLNERLDKHGRRQRPVQRRDASEKPKQVDLSHQGIQRRGVMTATDSSWANMYENAEEVSRHQERELRRIRR